MTSPEDILRDPAAIDTNRRGLISTPQRAALDDVARRATSSVFMLLAGGAAIGGLVWWLVPGYPALAFLPLVLLVLLSLPALRRLLLIWRAQREARTASVQHCTGRVIGEGDRLTIEAPGVQLAVMGLNALTPGSYRCYYLPQTGWLLSAEALGATSQIEERAAGPRPIDERLAGAFGNNSDDLIANRSGELTPRQVRRLRPDMARRALGCVLLIAMAVFAIWDLGRTLLPVIAGTGDIIALILPGLFTPIIVFVTLYALRQAYHLLADLRGRRVACFEGVLYKGSSRGSGKSITHYYTNVAGEPRRDQRKDTPAAPPLAAGEQRFEVSHAACDALDPGHRYRLYHLPRTRKVIAVEPIDPPAGQPAAPARAATPGARPLRRVRRR